MKRFWAVLVLALAVATVATVSVTTMPLEERLVRIQAEEAFPALFERFENEPIEVLAALTDYAEDELLLLKAQAAVIRYPELARRILPLYGPEPAFREVLRAHGESALLPITYFLENEIPTAAAAAYVSDKARIVTDTMRSWLGRKSGSQEGAPVSSTLGANDRGRLAVLYIHSEGHDFLGQFRLNAEGRIQWIQTERVLEGLGQFFVSGIRELETKARSGEKIEASDVGWALVDVASVSGAGFLLRAGKATTRGAKATRTASVAASAGAYGSRFAKASRVALKGLRYGKWPVAIATGVLVAKNPAIVADIATGFAQAIGAPPWLMILLAWSLLLMPVCYLALHVLPPLFRLAFAGSGLLGWGSAGALRPKMKA